MSSTPGTLAEYDMILALTQGTINSQFNTLYNTVDPNDSTQYLIQHTMKLGYMKYDTSTQTMKTSQQGITAQIASPTVDLNNVGSATLYRSIRIVIKMNSGTLSYWDEGDLNTLDVTGYTMSWVAGLGRRDIEDIEEEVMMLQDAKDVLQGVSQDDYLISSLFCLFESTQAVNTFQLLDKDGKQAQDSTQVAAVVNSLTITYTNIDHVKYPYVLGYGVSQRNPTSTTGTPAFCPAKFYFSTTPNTIVDQASVNFCMINGDSHDDNRVDPTINPSAGVLSSPFTTVTRSENSPSAGIFAVSVDMFDTYWLKPTILDAFSFSTSLFDGVSLTVTESPPTRNEGSTPGSSKAVSWTSDWIDTESLWTGKDRRKYTGNSTIKVTYTSILQNQPSGTIASNATRSVALKVVGYVYNKVEFNMDTAAGWVDEGYLDATTNWDFVLSIIADTAGDWTIEKTTWNVPGTTTQGRHLTAISYVEEALDIFENDYTCVVDFFTKLGDTNISAFNGVPDALKSISTNFVMPGGDVFDFTGLDCDDDGNLYAHVNYAS